MEKVLGVINVCCCCLILLFVLPRFLNNCGSHQSNAFFCSTEVFASGAIFLFIHQFFLKKLGFWGFSICSSFGRQLCPKMWMSGVGTSCANAHGFQYTQYANERRPTLCEDKMPKRSDSLGYPA